MAMGRLGQGPIAACATALVIAALSAFDAAATACPTVAVHPDTARLVQMGAGGDANAQAYDAVMSAPQATCQSNKSDIKVNLTFHIDAALGPNVEARTVRVPYFVVVMSAGKIVAKEVFPVALGFSPATPKLSLNETVDKISLPLRTAATAQPYEILVGFQLTAAQLRAVQN